MATGSLHYNHIIRI